jgi:serine O-acetyltransferase
LKNIKRHPTILDNVTIYANATVLGGDVVVGENSIIGANVWITQSIPKNSIVTYKSDIKISRI